MSIIRKARLKDIDYIHSVEKAVEGENAATKETLLSRFKMFPEGFLVAEEDDKIVGHVESCLWNKEDFETFDEIENFPKEYDPNGKTLYVIFLAVDEKYRKRGIGSELIKSLEKYARDKNLNKLQLVSGV